MRALALAIAALAAAPASAGAAIRQVEPLRVESLSGCVRATGTPGELAVETSEGVRFVQATRAGLKPGPLLEVGEPGLLWCASVDTRPSGAGVIAMPGETLSVAVRDPGGSWGAPVQFDPGEEWGAPAVHATVSDRGDVLVVWREIRDESAPGGTTQRVRAVRRAPGGTFGAVETIGAESPRLEGIVGAIAATGEAFVMRTTVVGDRVPFRAPVDVATAAPGAPFGAPVRVGEMPWTSTPALAAAADGRALVVVPDGRSVLVAERAPGAAFGPATPVAQAPGTGFIGTSATLGARGEAAVVWTRDLDGDGGVLTRTGPGAFVPSRALPRLGSAPASFDPFLNSQTFLADLLGTGLFAGATAPPPPALTADGRALLPWYDTRREPAAGALVSAPLAGGPLARQTMARGLEPAYDQLPLVLADGTAALVWTESTPELFESDLHLAADGAGSGREPALPKVTVGAPRKRTLGDRDPLRLPVRCTRPCEVRAAIPGGFLPPSGMVRLPRGGRGTLEIIGASDAITAPRARVRVELSYRAVGGSDARARTLRLDLARPAGAPDSRVYDVRAVRRGDTVQVTWRTRGRPDANASFYITASRTRSRAEEPLAVEEVDARRSRRAYSATLPVGAEAAWVSVRSPESLVTGRPATVRVG